MKKKIEKKNFEKKKLKKKLGYLWKKKLRKKFGLEKKFRSSTIVPQSPHSRPDVRPGVRPGVVDNRWRPNFGFFKPIFLFQT